MIKKILPLISIALVSFSCRPEPTYNPFDPLFDVNLKTLVQDGCDTISAGCGYMNLIRYFDEYSVYYQLDAYDYKKVAAKGLMIYMDTLPADYHSEHLYDSAPNAKWFNQIDLNNIDRILSNFELKRSGPIIRDKEYFLHRLIYKDKNGNDFHFTYSYMNPKDTTRIVQVFEILIGRRYDSQ